MHILLVVLKADVAQCQDQGRHKEMVQRDYH